MYLHEQEQEAAKRVFRFAFLHASTPSVLLVTLCIGPCSLRLPNAHLLVGFHGYGYFQATAPQAGTGPGMIQAADRPNVSSAYYDYPVSTPQPTVNGVRNEMNGSGSGSRTDGRAEITGHITSSSTTPALVAQALSGRRIEFMNFPTTFRLHSREINVKHFGTMTFFGLTRVSFLLSAAMTLKDNCSILPVMNNYHQGFGPTSPAGPTRSFHSANSPGPTQQELYDHGYVQAASPQPSGFQTLTMGRVRRRINDLSSKNIILISVSSLQGPLIPAAFTNGYH